MIAAVLAVESGGHNERPSITAAIDESGRVVKGKVSVGTLPSDARVVALVQGIRGGTATPLGRSDVGPNDEGKAELEFTTRLPAGRYDAVRVAAWTVAPTDDEPETADVACPQRGEPETGDTPNRVGKSCLRLPLAPAPRGPSLQAVWADASAQQVEITLKASNIAPRLGGAADARVALVVKRMDRERFSRYYRAILRPDADGKLDMKFKVPVEKARRICVSAMYLAKGEKPWVRCKGQLRDFKRGQVVVQLTRPKLDD